MNTETVLAIGCVVSILIALVSIGLCHYLTYKKELELKRLRKQYTELTITASTRRQGEAHLHSVLHAVPNPTGVKR